MSLNNKKPNILFICSDQHRYDSIGVNGNEVVNTPNLDKLAIEGKNFTNAYTPCPICTPARASMLTGMWSFNHHNITIPQWTESPRTHKLNLPTFSEELRNNGYYLDYIGKWHIDYGNEMLPSHVGFHSYVPEGEYDSWRSMMDIQKSSLDRNWEIEISPQEFDRMIRGGVDEYITVEESKLHWGANHVIEMLKQRERKDQPFFVRWDPSEPHPTNIVPEPYASMYQPEHIKPWGSFEDDFKNKPFIQRQQLYSWGIQDWTWKDWAPIVARYYGEISLLDYEIGRVIECLDTLNLRENTIVIYTTDHGDLRGSHRMMDKQYVMYDDVTKVPLIVNWPGKIMPGVHDDFISHAIDLASTICELTGSVTPDTFQGISLVPLIMGGAYEARQDILSAYHGGQFGLYSQRMIRNQKWKYVWNLTAEDELYDMESDPWELDNKAGKIEFKNILDQNRIRLVEWLQETGDPLLNVWTNYQLSYGRKL